MRSQCPSIIFEAYQCNALFLEPTMVVPEKQIKLPCEFNARSELLEKRGVLARCLLGAKVVGKQAA